MLVSSANKIGRDLSFINLGKSFINTRKRRGLKTGFPNSTTKSHHQDTDMLKTWKVQHL